jgi:integrase
MSGWQAVHGMMVGLTKPHASPKGLRHGFGVTALSAGIPLNLVQKWLGADTQLTTTASMAMLPAPGMVVTMNFGPLVLTNFGPPPGD